MLTSSATAQQRHWPYVKQLALDFFHLQGVAEDSVRDGQRNSRMCVLNHVRESSRGTEKRYMESARQKGEWYPSTNFLLKTSREEGPDANAGAVA